MASDLSMASADTIRQALTAYLPDGFRDEDGVWHDGPVRQDALAAVDALLAVGERDKAEASAHTSLRAELAHIFGPVKPREGQTWNEAMLGRITEVLAGERDRQHIAQLTDALETLTNPSHWAIQHAEGGKRWVWVGPRLGDVLTAARAVLADKEDAGGGASQTCVRESGTRDTDTSGTVADTSPSARAAGEGDT